MSEWIIAGQWTVSKTRSNWYGHTYRQIIQAAVIPVSGMKVRLTFKASSKGVLDITNCFVGICEGTNPAGAAFKEEPTRVTFGGNNGVSISAGGSVVSDEIDYVYDQTDGDALVVSYSVTAQRLHANLIGRATAGGVSLHYITGNHAGDMPGELGEDIFRFDPDFQVLSVSRVELFSGNVPDEPVTKNIKSDYAVLGFDGNWFLEDEWTPNTFENNFAGYTGRVTVSSSVIPYRGVRFRITAKAPSGQGVRMAECFFGEGSGTDYQYLGTPTRVTWNGGNNGFEIATAGGELISDPINVTYDPASGHPLVMSFYTTPDTPSNLNDYSKGPATGWASYFKSGNDVSTVAATGYTSIGNNIGIHIVRIEALVEYADETEVSKFSIYPILDEPDGVEISKLSLYVASSDHSGVAASKFGVYTIYDASPMVSLESDYAVNSDIVISFLESDYAIQDDGPVILLNSDYAIDGDVLSSLDSDYRIYGPFTVDLLSDYQILSNAFDVTLQSDFRILGTIQSSLSSDYSFLPDPGVSIALGSDYAIDLQPPLDLPAIELYPLEPVREAWAWLTLINISHSGKEQRIALRQRPRIMISYNIAVPDETLRIGAYRQLYDSVGKTPRIPFFQYATALTEPLLAGQTEMRFDPDKTYIQNGTPVCLYLPRTNQYIQTDVLTMTPTGAFLSEPLAFNLKLGWLIMPVYFMRLPNLNSISMEALTGEYTLAGEQAFRRRFVRLESTVTVPEFEGMPILSIRPIAVNSVEERFDSNAEVLDNNTGMPQPYSSYENPFVDGSLQWLLDRDIDMDFWRAFLDAIRGQQLPFLMPTWREDLTPISQGASHIVVKETDYSEKFSHETYKLLQIEMPSGVYHRKVTSTAPDGDNLRVTLSEALPAGDILTVSFLNKVRLNEDIIYLDHFRHHSTITLPIRTINE